MATIFGKELRKLRIDNDERLLEMSRRIGKSAAFISAVERGTKKIPTDFEEVVISAYNLAADGAVKLRRAADRSRDAFTLNANTDLARDTAGLMARRMSSRMKSLSDDELQQIIAILKKGDQSRE